ncbi:uncharacterized protein BDW43DRAFT_316165 [Aspergillus alliaceus]|uniref:uncharacterized protein n=1 Tax=Petromyces alliaceus TaxID=209559 RepID=UPI0012A451B6|nr:uncharacterized protein BDW43DRAFT_316165 [Aspergillus alliaceus]KAB8228187.1 hypothetical protein BDW43DRAFT_316165 [Aspergillus alliaceus]
MKYEDLENQPDLAKVTSNNEGQAIPMAAEDMTTERGLKSRHAQMLALGATLVQASVGSGQSFYMGGPVCLVVTYCLITGLVFGIVTAATEMSSYLPIPGSSMSYFASRFFSSSLCFALGCLLLYLCYLSTSRHKGRNASRPVLGLFSRVDYYFTVLIVGLNCFPVRFYGEVEFWFASLKVIGIVGLLIMAVVLVFGGGTN